jgi:hypothetical protein
LPQVKTIHFLGNQRRILLQNENGPCPILACANVLALRNELQFSEDFAYYPLSQLQSDIANLLLDAGARLATTGSAEDARQQTGDAIALLPRLSGGLDVNCMFKGPRDFEYTQELTVFDGLSISLYHGWVCSAQDEETFSVLGSISYNQAVERLIAFEEWQSSDMKGDIPKAAKEGHIVKDWFEQTASQLSYDGLLQLHETVTERQLGVFFRNNHFGTIFKMDSSLYVLATDIGFAGKGVVWERLDEVNGDTVYCDANFQEVQIDDTVDPEAQPVDAAVAGSFQNQDDLDYQLALQMQREADNAATQAVLQSAAVAGPGVAPVAASGQVQGQPEAAAAPPPNAANAQVQQPAPKKKKKKSACSIQ